MGPVARFIPVRIACNFWSTNLKRETCDFWANAPYQYWKLDKQKYSRFCWGLRMCQGSEWLAGSPTSSSKRSSKSSRTSKQWVIRYTWYIGWPNRPNRPSRTILTIRRGSFVSQFGMLRDGSHSWNLQISNIFKRVLSWASGGSTKQVHLHSATHSEKPFTVYRILFQESMMLIYRIVWVWEGF